MLLRNWILTILIILTGFAVIVPMSGYIEAARPALPAGYEDTDLMFRGSRLKGFALGTEGLIADWYWMRSLQYIGDKLVSSRADTINIEDLRDLNPRLLYPLLDNATDLDPRFLAAYSYGSLVLPAIDPEKAIRIAEKGITNNPEQWRLYQYLGYTYWRLGEYEKAAATYERGSRVSGSAPFMKMMAASMTSKGGSRDTARQIYRQMLGGSDGDANVEITARRRLMELDSLDERDAIDKALAEFKERSGRCASRLIEIAPLLNKVRLPEGRDFMVDKTGQIVDPSGAPYLLDQGECRVKLDVGRTDIPTK